MGSIIKFFVFLLGLVGLSASKKKKAEVKKIDKKVKENKKQAKVSKKKVSTAKKVSKKKVDSIKKTEAKKKQIKKKFTEENDALNNSIISDFRVKVRTDSVVVAELSYQIKTHEETIKLLGKKVMLVRPKWYENKYVWAVMGSAPAYYIVYIIGKL